VGKGSFIASGTLVTKDIPPFSLAKGSPVRFEQLLRNYQAKTTEN
jgi:acetyltransferase-like isoleucine patch superfamily enzyme